MTQLHYKARAQVEELSEGECTIRRCSGASGPGWWELWFYVRRETDGVLEDFAVPVSPGGAYTESGPGGKTWGLANLGGGVWQVSPSINVVQDDDAKRIHAGEHPTLPSLWHQTPSITGVPSGEPWQ